MQGADVSAGCPQSCVQGILSCDIGTTDLIQVYSTVMSCRGNVLELLDDIQELSPHMFVSVPRLFNRIYDRVNATIRDSNPISRKLFETAYASKKAALDRGDLSGGRMGAFWDKLVFSKIKARLGGKARTGMLPNMHLSNVLKERISLGTHELTISRQNRSSSPSSGMSI